MAGFSPCSCRVRHNGITEHAQLLYNAVLVSATQHSESALSIHMSPPSQTSLPFPTPKSLLITILEMIIYTPLCVCVCVCVCTPFWWLRRYRICLQWGYPGPISGLARSPGEGNYETVQYSCLENFMDRGAWWAIFHGVTQSWRWLNMCICIHINTHINMYIYAIYMLYVYICSVMFDFAKAIFCNIQ